MPPGDEELNAFATIFSEDLRKTEEKKGQKDRTGRRRKIKICFK